MSWVERISWWLIITVLILLLASRTLAEPLHDMNDPAHWYEAACCDLRDCAPMSSDEFYLDDGDIVVIETGERFPLTNLRPSQDGGWHRCTFPDRSTRKPGSRVCIYQPQGF